MHETLNQFHLVVRVLQTERLEGQLTKTIVVTLDVRGAVIAAPPPRSAVLLGQVIYHISSHGSPDLPNQRLNEFQHDVTITHLKHGYESVGMPIIM